MSLEAANDQDGGHSSTMDVHGVSNPPSMQVSDNGDGSSFVTRDELRAQFKNFESMLAQFQDNLVASWSHPSTQVGQQASNGNQTVLQGSQQFSNGRQPLVQSRLSCLVRVGLWLLSFWALPLRIPLLQISLRKIQIRA